jgi:hypothetical protein
VTQRVAGSALSTLIVLTCVVSASPNVLAADEIGSDVVDPRAAAPSAPPSIDARSGGVMQESFQYHRQGYGDTRWNGPHAPHSNVAPAGGWYGYGFPVQTHRWGWFGAGRYYPRVVWHRGYYDDCCRWAYRPGY